MNRILFEPNIPKKYLFFLLVLITFLALAPVVQALPIHPGAYVTQTDLDNLRNHIASGLDPWASGYDAMMNTGPDYNYQPSVSSTITDSYAIQNQGHAAWHLAVKWAASGDMRYATACQRVIDAWVNTVTDMTQTTTLRTGIGGCQMAQAAEIMAWGFNGASGWPAANIAAAKAWFKAVPYKVISGGVGMRSGNWGTSAMTGCMAMAIFCDDQGMFDYAVNAYKNGFTDTGDGFAGVTQYIDATGENAEMGRDQGHSQGGIGHLLEVARMAWNQGVNLVTYNNTDWGMVDVFGNSYGVRGSNRLFLGHEYSAKYNLGFTVPYHPFLFGSNQIYYADGISGRGSLSGTPIWEMATRLFTDAGLTPVFSKQAINEPGYAPEGTGGDHCGFGTLLYRTGTGTIRPVVDSQSLYITYNGSWSTWNTSVDYQGSEVTSNTAGNYAQWTFTGTQVQWITRKASNMGQADVYIDGVLIATVDNYSAAEQAQAIAFSQTGLPNASHTIKIVVKRAKSAAASDYKIAIDAFKTDPAPPSIPDRPTGLTADTPDVAPYVQVILNWTPSSGATGYNIKRATLSAGPYVMLASLTGTTYTDTSSSLSAGVSYYYVVSAVNSVGETINSVEATACPGMIDDASSTIIYNAMNVQKINGDFNTTEHYSGTAGSYAQWSFTGTNVQWYTRLKGDGGRADVYIDGILKASNVDTYSSLPVASFQKAVYSITGLSNGPHTIKVVVNGSKNASSKNYWVVVDAFGVNSIHTTYLSDLTPTSSTNGWGPIEKDTSNGESAAGDGHTIRLNGVTYTKGLGVHANSEVDYALNGVYSSFKSDIGVDDEVSKGSVVFQVWADGAKLYDSGVMTSSSPTQSINLNISGKNQLQLIVTDAGDGNGWDHSDWAGAQLLP